MKRIPWPVALIFIIAAFAFAYYRYEYVFTVRPPKSQGPPGMPASAGRLLREKALKDSQSTSPGKDEAFHKADGQAGPKAKSPQAVKGSSE